MTILSLDQKAKIIACLTEGLSIRSTERLTGHHRDSVMRLGVEIGEGCQRVHDALMVNLTPSSVEMDEVWSWVKKKRRNVTAEDSDEVGDIYVYLALDSISKAYLTWRAGKRNTLQTHKFVADLRKRVANEPEFSTDGWIPYQSALDAYFRNAPRGVVDKQVVVIAGGPDSSHYWARETLVKIERKMVVGAPSRVTTSYIERANLNLRMSQRRLTRLSNGFSKKYRNHCAAISLFATHSNFCKVHEALRTSPAVHLGITDHVWSVAELTEAALTGIMRQTENPIKRGFRVIQGGWS